METWVVLIAGAVSLVVVVILFVMLSRIETATREAAATLKDVLREMERARMTPAERSTRDAEEKAARAAAEMNF